MTQSNEIDKCTSEMYRIVTVCKECGVVDEDFANPDVDVEPTEKIQEDPAKLHHDRTGGHAARSFSVKDAPADIQEMVDRGNLSDGEIERIDEWVMTALWGGSDE